MLETRRLHASVTRSLLFAATLVATSFFARTSRVLMTCVAVAMAWSFAPAVTHAQDAPVDPEPAQEAPEVPAEKAEAPEVSAKKAEAAAQAAAIAADRTSARSAMAESRWEDAAAAWKSEQMQQQHG